MNNKGPAPSLKNRSFPKPKAFGSCSAGFTLIEILVVFAISALVVINLLTNVLRTRINLVEVASIIISDIRTVQANALASKQYVDPTTGVTSYRCGYGLSHTNNDTAGYFLYAGNFNAGGNCPGSEQYTGSDNPIFFTRILDSRVETVESNDYKDIYFESPNAKIYIKNKSCPANANQNKSQILLRRKNKTCPSADCIYICVYAFGQIESRKDPCPDIAC